MIEGIITMKKKEQTIVTLAAEVAVTETEDGLDYIQILPENPRVGLVKPFCGWGRGQMLSNGTFDFLRHKRVHNKPEYRVGHTSLSYGVDGYDRCIFTRPNGQRDEFAGLLQKDVKRIVAYLKKKGL